RISAATPRPDYSPLADSRAMQLHMDLRCLLAVLLPNRRRKRNTLVTLMLVIAAALLAIGLFAAGSIWRGRASPKPSVTGKVQPSSLWETRPSPAAEFCALCVEQRRES